jgi:hypothetical protein
MVGKRKETSMSIKASRIIGIPAITMIHAGMSVSLFFLSFQMSMDRFDTGGAPSWGERLVDLASDVILWPVLAPLLHWRSGMAWCVSIFGEPVAFYGLLLINSLVWAIVIWFVVERVQTRRSQRLQTPPAP